VITFPNCKVNLGLRIVARRNDGFHDLETIFLPIPFEDCLEVERSKDTTTLTISGLPIEGETRSNLCMKAYELLQSKFALPPLDIKLHKQIPTGAGLGGGSADAAFMLKLLNNKFNLQLTTTQLINLASQLGSDCAFFIINKPCIGTGRGELLQPIELPQLDGMFGILVMPGIHVSSAWAFQQITPTSPAKSITESISSPIQNWKHELENDFEGPVFKTYPELMSVKEKLYASGAIYASLTGSGSALYGLYQELPTISFPSQYTVKSFVLHSKESQ
jgi:4-diphosphocytidyl-2-C-methyl-D-erythritol kinase